MRGGLLPEASLGLAMERARRNGTARVASTWMLAVIIPSQRSSDSDLGAAHNLLQTDMSRSACYQVATHALGVHLCASIP